MSEADAMRYLNEKAIPNMREYGWTVEAHMDLDAPTSDTGEFVTYTSGLTEAGVPELVISGLPHEIAAVMLNDVAALHLRTELRAGMTVHAAGGAPLQVVDAPGVVGPVARALFGQRARFLQLLWPNAAGQFPTDADTVWSRSGHPKQPTFTDPLPAERLPQGDGVLGHYDQVALRHDREELGRGGAS